MSEVAEVPAKSARRAGEAATFGPRAMLISAAVGFGIGVVVTLAFAPLATGHGAGAKKHIASPTPTAVPLASSVLRADIRKLATQELGRSPATGRMRPVNVTLAPTSAGPPFVTSSEPTLYDATISFPLNPNPLVALLGPKSQAGSAHADCFLILKALYGHDLPLDRIQMVGLFHFPKSVKPEVVMRVAIDPSIAAEFGVWKKLSRSSEGRVWSALRPHWLAKQFVNYKLKL